MLVNDRIHNEAPELLNHGDICIILVPIELLTKGSEKERDIFLSVYFFQVWVNSFEGRCIKTGRAIRGLYRQRTKRNIRFTRNGAMVW